MKYCNEEVFLRQVHACSCFVGVSNGFMVRKTLHLLTALMAGLTVAPVPRNIGVHLWANCELFNAYWSCTHISFLGCC